MNNPTTYDSTPSQASGMPTGTMPAGGTEPGTSGGSSLKEQAKAEAQNLKQAAGEQVQQVASIAKTEAERARAAAENKLTEVKTRARSATETIVNEKKQRVAGQLGLVTEALTKTSEKLHQDQHGAIAQYTDLAAEKVEEFRRTIETKDIGDIVDDVQRFARRQPALVFGGLFLAGLATMRFMKASSHDRTQREIDRHVAGGSTDQAYGRTLSPQQATIVTGSDPMDRVQG